MDDEITPYKARRVVDAFYHQNTFPKVTDEGVIKIYKKLVIGGWLIQKDPNTYRTRYGRVIQI